METPPHLQGSHVPTSAGHYLIRDVNCILTFRLVKGWFSNGKNLKLPISFSFSFFQVNPHFFNEALCYLRG